MTDELLTQVFEAILKSRRLVAECAISGFTEREPIENLYYHNGELSRILDKLAANPATPEFRIMMDEDMKAFRESGSI